MNDEQFFYHPLDNIEDIEPFSEAVERENFAPKFSLEKPYTYWTAELFDQENGFIGDGELGILAGDMRRLAEENQLPLTLITPFYPQKTIFTLNHSSLHDEVKKFDYSKYGFNYIDRVFVKCYNKVFRLDVIEKKFKNTRILSITEPHFGELYAESGNSDHRLYQNVSLGFGGYKALKLLGLKPGVMHLNGGSTFFAVLARLDELVSNGMDFYEAVVYTRKHTLYTNHDLSQNDEPDYTYQQFTDLVFPNLKSLTVKKWISDRFVDNCVKLSSVAIELSEMRSGVSKICARGAIYHDVAGEKIKFKPITSGISMKTWILPEIIQEFKDLELITDNCTPISNIEAIESLTAEKIRSLKLDGRQLLNQTLKNFDDLRGSKVKLKDDDYVFCLKHAITHSNRPDLPFRDTVRLRNILEPHNAHLIIAGQISRFDLSVSETILRIAQEIERDDFLKNHVHFISGYNEKLACGLSRGVNATISLPKNNTRACGISWMKDVGNLDLIISNYYGSLADASPDSFLCVSGDDEASEVDMLYQKMEEAIAIWNNDFDLEYLIHKQLKAYLPTISGVRMLKEYLDFIHR